MWNCISKLYEVCIKNKGVLIDIKLNIIMICILLYS